MRTIILLLSIGVLDSMTLTACSPGGGSPEGGAPGGGEVSQPAEDTSPSRTFDAATTGDPERGPGVTDSYAGPWRLEEYVRGAEAIIFADVVGITGHYDPSVRRAPAWSDVRVSVREWLTGGAGSPPAARGEEGLMLNEWCAEGYEDHCVFVAPGRFKLGSTFIGILGVWPDTYEPFGGLWFVDTVGGYMPVHGDRAELPSPIQPEWDGVLVEPGTTVDLADLLARIRAIVADPAEQGG